MIRLPARFGWPLAYAASTFLAFPHYVGGRVVDLGLIFAWLAPACLLLAITGRGPRAGARSAFFAAWLAQSAILHWIYVVTVTYGHAPAVVGIVAPVGLALYTAVFFAVFGAVYAWLERRGAASPLAVALLWTALDHARSFVLTGWPWATLGYAQHDNGALLGLASATGVYGLSFVSVLAGAALFGVYRAARQRRRPALRDAVALAVVVALHGLGLALRPPERAASAELLRVAALQGNVDQGVKWSPEWSTRIFGVYEELSRRAASQGARLILWPETALPGLFELDEPLRARVAALVRETGATHVIGGMGIRRDPAHPGIAQFFDSAFLIAPDGTLSHRYDKSHLVPFGEYVPLRDLLGHFFEAVARGIASQDVTAGRGPEALALRLPAEGEGPGAPEPGPASLRAGVPICYELLFPDLVRRFVGDGAQLLLAITNDAWYGRTGAPYQFLAMTAMRSAEAGVWTLRAANTGVSAVIDARGRVRSETRIFERDLLVADVPLHPPAGGSTFYVRHGDVFAWTCWGALGLYLGFARWRRGSNGHE